MSRRVIALILWTVGVLLGGQLLLGFFCGFLYENLYFVIGNTPFLDLVMQWVASIGLLVCLAVAVCTIYLGVKSKLPYQVVRHPGSAA